MDSGPLGLFQQLPTGIIVMFCGSGILLVIVMGFIFRARVVKAQGAVPPPVDDHSAADLPDLDSLASDTSYKPTPAAPPPPAPAAPRSSGAHTLTLIGGETVEVVEVLSVLRDVGEGGLIIRIGDKAYRNPPAQADSEFKRRFQATMRDLSGAQRPAPAPTPAEVVADDDDMPPLDLPPEAQRLSPYQPAPGDLPKFKMPDGPPVKPKRGQRPVAEPIPEINIAASIETFLQHKLSMTPMYASRSIHVRPALHGGVTIEVDGRFYETVSEVEDEGVRIYLAATIEEWQARQ